MSKSYLLWAVIGTIGYSVTATMVKLATQSGRFSSYFVLMISSAMVVATSTTITVLRGDMKTFCRDNLVSADGMFVLGAGVALGIAVVSYLLALSEGPTSLVVPIYGMFIVGGAVLGLVFLHEPLTLRKALGILSPPAAFILSRATRRVEPLKQEGKENWPETVIRLFSQKLGNINDKSIRIKKL